MSDETWHDRTIRGTNIGGEVGRAFIPYPLPPDPPLEMSHKRQLLLERATLALGRLDSITLLLPDPDLFLYSYVRREAVLSSQIEGTQSSLADLLLFELEQAPGAPLDDVVEVSNDVAALEHGLMRLREGFPLSNRLLREMHRALLSRGRGSEKSPGEFRRTQNWIGGTRPGNAHFVPPPPPHYVEDCMAALERFLHDENNPYPFLIKAALAHVQFETIHPFLDGYGRIGRLLIAFILHHDRVLSRPLLYLSLYFKHRAEYYRRMDAVRGEGDWESWVDFCLEGVEQTASNAVEPAGKIVALFEEDERKIHTLGRSASTCLRVFSVFRQRPLVSINEIVKQTSLSFPAVGKAMQMLADLEVVHEITGQRRNRVFAYDRYLSILNEGPEPQ